MIGRSLSHYRVVELLGEQHLKTLELDSSHPRAYYYLGRAYLGKGEPNEAIGALVKASELSNADRRIVGVLGHAYAVAGRHDEARRLLDEFEQPAEPWLRLFSLYAMTVTFLGLREHNRAIQCLQELYAARSPLLRWLKVDPLFDPVRSNPRFATILKGMGLAG